MGEPFEVKHFNSWGEAKQWLESFPPSGWGFRGQRKCRWPLISSLERVKGSLSLREAEIATLVEFRRRIHHYLPAHHIPASSPGLFETKHSALPFGEDKLEWLALMQHYGAPTRLVDWTRSPYVAAYFAFEDAEFEPGENADNHVAIWAIDFIWCKLTGLKALREPRTGTGFDGNQYTYDPRVKAPDCSDLAGPLYLKEALRDAVAGVYPVEPYRMNERLTAQQGFFLYPGVPDLSFEENLLSYPEGELRERLQKAVIPNSCRPGALRDLNRMNLNRATLFPGLDGFAQSLRHRFVYAP